MSKELAKLFASRFIQRADVKAVQLEKDAGALHQGDWFPDNRVDPAKRPNSPHLPHGFQMPHLLAHLAGERTYGHYLLDDSDHCKVFVFDIDLIDGLNKDDPEGKKLGTWVSMDADTVHEDVNPRELWQDRRAVEARTWYKYQMKRIGHMLATKVRELGIDCGVAYSGSKGIHVYGMTGSLPAKEVREAAMLVLDMTDEFEELRGKNFFKHKNDDPVHGFQNFSIEVFPKQDTLDGKNLGNLVRLPLGRNFKNPKDPTFFLDMTAPIGEFKPHSDPIKLLTEGECFA